MSKTYNINELLEKKKHLESQINEKMHIRESDLTYVEENIIDRVTPENNRKIIPRKRITLEESEQVLFGYVQELSKIKAAIQTYNTGSMAQLLSDRDAVRQKITFLNRIREELPRESDTGRRVLSQDSDRSPIEIAETKTEPMFELTCVEKQLDELAAEERKLNTEIQKLNLNAEITLS